MPAARAAPAGVQGAVQTMAVAMMRKPENRAAAVTMLGKTVDLASQQVLRRARLL